jgi:hypothetical protein
VLAEFYDQSADQVCASCVPQIATGSSSWIPLLRPVELSVCFNRVGEASLLIATPIEDKWMPLDRNSRS